MLSDFDILHGKRCLCWFLSALLREENGVRVLSKRNQMLG
jgi:hypothetical protein